MNAPRLWFRVHYPRIGELTVSLAHDVVISGHAPDTFDPRCKDIAARDLARALREAADAIDAECAS